ncbi:MAG: aminodeoxychorismate synthase component I [Actinomycetota bacterium]
MIEVRFDDLLATPPASLRFKGQAGTIEAYRPEAVADALAAAVDATSRGLWAAGYVAYEASPGLDPALAGRSRPPEDPFAGLPLVWFGLFEDRIEESVAVASGHYSVSEWEPSISRNDYETAVERIRDYIRDGDTYQINFTLRLRAEFSGDEQAFYSDLCAAQRAGQCAYIDTGRFRILSASPELFLEVDKGRVITRPMKGTASRGRTYAEDEATSRRLVDSPKERAENAMIVDLLRNDLGRVAEPGSVKVPKLFEAERYETLWQMTSTVGARLREGVDPTAAFRVLFPSGSVTGAPKVRSMQIAAELEDSPRGVYTGAIGFLAPAGAEGPDARFNVAIRTVVIDPETGAAEYGVGGGITYDSVAAREWEECLTKARVLGERRPEFELIETIRYSGGEFPLMARHLARMASSAAYFGFRFEKDEVAAALESSVADLDDARVRLALARDGELTVTTAPLPAANPPPVRLAVDYEPVDSKDPFLFHKTTRRDLYEERAKRHPGADDVLLVNERREITESTIANVAVELDGKWFTPPADSGCLPGVYRQELIEEGRIEERILSVSNVLEADGLALMSAVRLWRKATL